MLLWEFPALMVTLMCVQVGQSFMRPGLKSGTCAVTYVKSMKGYDCVGLNLGEIPQSLSTSTEILDASLNRIRALTNSSFKKYSNLRKLFLNDNMILTIESEAFNGMSNLDTLDLSMNALLEVPTSIFYLPSLNRLLLGGNLRLDLMSLLEAAIPATAPIQYLDIAYSPLLTRLPKLGSFVDLIHLNVSGNNLTELSIDSFIGLCNLKYFTSEDTSTRFNSPCDCRRLQGWFEHANVSTRPHFQRYCDFIADACLEDVGPNKEEIAAHESCRIHYNARVNLRSVWRILYIIAAILGGSLLFVGVCYVYYRTQRLPDLPAKPPIENDKTTSLLAPNNNDT